MRFLVVLVALLAALLGGAVALVTFGTAAGAGVAVLSLFIAIYGGWFASAGARSVAFLVVLAITIGAVGFGGWTGMQLMSGLTTTSGPADPADAAALASESSKVDEAKKNAAFRLDLTDAEVAAAVQDGLQHSDGPVRRVDVHFVGPSANAPTGALQFVASFKNGSLTANGSVGYAVEPGGISVSVRDVSIGAVNVPKPALSALQDIVRRVADVNSGLREQRMTVQTIIAADGKMTMIGTSGNGNLNLSKAVLGGFQSRSQGLGQTKQPPAEQFGPGVVNAKDAPGTAVYVALGDSLAANVGVATPRDGYVSRFHNQLQKRDGKQYGLRNFGISGETSGTMLQGQLDQAIAFMKTADVSYVTIDIGANDLLAHLGSDDCANGADAPLCKARIDASLETYKANLTVIMRRVQAAAPKAKVLFLLTYSPFSFGFQGVKFEDDTSRATQQLNQIAADVARAQGAIIADGFTPMVGLATTATHMTDSPPDIHPRAIGEDILTGALLAAK